MRNKMKNIILQISYFKHRIRTYNGVKSVSWAFFGHLRVQNIAIYPYI